MFFHVFAQGTKVALIRNLRCRRLRREAVDRFQLDSAKPRDRIPDVPFLTAVEVRRSLPKRPTLPVDFAAKRLKDLA